MTPPEPGPDLRRGLGFIFLLFGALCCVMMAAAALYAENRLSVRISVKGWQQIYLAHFFCLTSCGAGYLWLGWRQSGQVPTQSLMDYALGMFLYAAVFLTAGLLLAAGRVPSWFALAPGFFLLYYGWVLRQGKAFLSALDRPRKPL